MDGVEVLRRIREAHGALPVVAISASALEHSRRHYLASGFDAFVDKPFRVERIYECIAELLGVQYEYAEPVREDAVAAEHFAGLVLPAELRARICRAAEMHNVTEVKLCLGQMRVLGARESQLAARLGDLVQRFDLSGALAILEETVDG